MKIALTEVPFHETRAPRPALHVAIFGAGSGGTRAWETLTAMPGVHVVAFLDNDERRRGEQRHGLPVMLPGDHDLAELDAIVIGSMFGGAITEQLVSLGFPRARIHTAASFASQVPARGPDTAGPRPRFLNFQVNDICNARCVMCNIWQNKRDYEMSPEEFGRMMSDPYFSELKLVGITGGEPTLRRDLPEYYRVLADACPKLEAGAFITHGLDTERAVAAYSQIAADYRARGLAFSGMVSIDGVGEVHDTIRGRKNAFERATRTLFELNAAGVSTIVCCTVVRGNVWGLRDLLEWSRGKTYVRFRVAEFIRRLGNDGRGEQIRSFDDTEVSELISFFQYLIDSYEPEEYIRRTYTSIVEMLGGGPRLISCGYRSGEALSVDCRGNFAVCAPKGVPHPLGERPEEAVGAQAGERDAIAAQHCASCIHDTHHDWHPEAGHRLMAAASVRRHLEAPVLRPAAPAEIPGAGSADVRKVLVLGWYGTETIGDLAIIAGIFDEYRCAHPGVRFVVPSHYPAYTRHNFARMGLDCEVATYGDAELLGGLWNCDTVIIGGGPLMDIPQLVWLANVFERARLRGCRTIVESCGVGPVNRPETAEAIRRIAAAADVIRVRDAGSARLLQELTGRAADEVVEDPGARWVRATGVGHRGKESAPICVFARELTDEYPQATSPEEATARVAAFLSRVCDWFPDREVRLQAMHHFPVGGDDREYARRLAALVDRPNCTIDRVPRTAPETVDIAANAAFVICMRFHSLVFAHTVGAPLLAIDYTDGGKVAHYAREHGIADRLVTFDSLPTLDRDAFEALGLRGADRTDDRHVHA
jgi:polysaccharide pyruvyl transferase WcaK-like protein/MoaA/NifB/PqqE/SkfB family radical SAM enzyme